jgi:hypothetical protein
MSVPLDRLYSFLASLVNDNVVIYRWDPHGSKNLSDLTMLKYTSAKKWFTTPLMFCHDQEPLDFSFYSAKDTEEYYKESDSYPIAKQKDAFNKLYKGNIRDVAWEHLYDCAFLTHSEQNSKQVLQYECNGFVPVYFWSHGLIAIDWFRYAKHDPSLRSDVSNVTHDFLVYNRAWHGTREYRLKFTEELITSGLADNSISSFNEYDNGQHYADYKFINEQFNITRKDLHQILPANLHTPGASADYCSLDYNCAGIEVVLETLFDDERWHLTEKSLRPIACGMPFIIASTAGSLKYLRSYGFKTFSNFIDESYDTIADPVSRLKAIIKEMQRIANLPLLEKQRLWQELQNIANYNKQFFFSDNFQQKIILEFLENFKKADEKMKKSAIGNHWNQYSNFFSEDFHKMPAHSLKVIDGIPEPMWVAQWLKNNTTS